METMLKPFVELTKEEVKDLQRLRVTIEEKESRTKNKYYNCILNVFECYTLKSDFNEFNNIKFELIKLENGFTNYKNTFSYNTPCRFFKGVTKKGFTYYRIQAILSKSVAINFFLSYDLAKLLELKKVDFNWYELKNSIEESENEFNYNF